MKVWVIKLLNLAMLAVTGAMDLDGKLLYWSLFATADGAGLTFGSLFAFCYVFYVS